MNASVFKTSHYKQFINGKRPKKWSPTISINYGNEKTRPRKRGGFKGESLDIWSTDVTKGCDNGCVECYAAKMSAMAMRNFGCVKTVKLIGKPKGNPFIWTAGQGDIPKCIIDSKIGVIVTVDPMREKSFVDNSIKAVLSVPPRQVLIGFRVYPKNMVSIARCLKLAKYFRAKGYKGIFHMIVRINSLEMASRLDSIICPKGKVNRKIFYEDNKIPGLGLACGSKGNGTCADCMFCFNYHNATHRVGTSSDPLRYPKHLVSEFKRVGWIKS